MKHAVHIPKKEVDPEKDGNAAQAASAVEGANGKTGPVARFIAFIKKFFADVHAWHQKLPKGKRRAMHALEIVVGAFIAFCLVIWLTCLTGLPKCDSAEAFNTNRATEVYASDGTTLLARFQLECREPLESLDDISEYVVKGTVNTEDERFYYHPGVDVISIGRAVISNISGGTFQGASTITQQLVRNTVLRDEMQDIKLRRKIREAYLALKMETMYNKDDILLLYLNTINYGDGAYGIESAAKRYFSKSAKDLTLAEAATLIGIPQSPEYNNPHYYPDHAKERRDLVLDRMLACDTITKEECEAAKAEEITLTMSELQLDGLYKYPYFASYVRDQLIDEYDVSTDDILKGMKVISTLDVKDQEAAEAAAQKRLEGMSDALDVALVSIEPSTGYIKALIGGRDFKQDQWNCATQGQRQTGSSFKVFTLIAALEAGISPNTQVDATSWVRLGTDMHVFHNSGFNDHGITSMRAALAVSSNTAFVRLCDTVGVDKVQEVARRLGVTSDLADNVTLTLGSSAITPLEMARAFGAIATGGVLYPTTCILTATNAEGDVIIDNTKISDKIADGSEQEDASKAATEQVEDDDAIAERVGTRVLSPEIAHAATECMKTVVTNGTGTAARLANGRVAAGKTGTTDDSRDSWFVGFTPQRVVACWGGDRDNKRSVYGNMCGMFKSYMDAALEGQENLDFPSAGDPPYGKKFKTPDLDSKVTESPTLMAKKVQELTAAIPDLTGKTVTEVQALLNAELAKVNKDAMAQIGFELKVEEQASTKPADTVLSYQVTGTKGNTQLKDNEIGVYTYVNMTLTVARAGGADPGGGDDPVDPGGGTDTGGKTPGGGTGTGGKTPGGGTRR